MAYIPVDSTPNMDLNMEAMTEQTLVHEGEMNPRYKQLLNNDKSLAYPAFDDSGATAGISSFTDFLGTVKSRMRIFDFFRNFKSGMQFVMHLGRAANNCTTTSEGLYLDARQGKVLMDLVTKLNSDLAVIGTFTYKSTETVTASHGNSTYVHSLDLPSGTWLIESQITWGANSTGRREHVILQGNAWDSTLLAGNTHPPDPMAQTYQNCVAIVKLSADITISVWGVQTSGGDLGVGGTVKAIRVK